MALQKQAIDISFAKGLDTKTDKKRVPIGNFLRLENQVFNKGGLLEKRNGYAALSSLPDTSYTYTTTFKDNLTAVGTDIAALNNGSSKWVQKGSIEPMSLSVLPVIRNNFNQSSSDVAISESGTACVVYRDNEGPTTVNKYAVFDSVTGQNIVAPTPIPVASGTVSGGMRVFTLSNKFIILFTNNIGGTNHLQYVAININEPTTVTANTDIASSYVPSTNLSFDAYPVGSNLYIAYNTTSGGQSVKVTYLTSSLTVVTPTTYAGQIATSVSVTADLYNPGAPIIYISVYDSASTDGYMFAVNAALHSVLSPTQIIATETVANVTSVASNGICYFYYEITNNYTFTSGTGQPTNYIKALTVTLATTTVSAKYVVIRSVGLGSKAFMIGTTIYFLTAYSSLYQSTFFVVNGSTSVAARPVIAGKIAYENGGGYRTRGVPNVTLSGTTAKTCYVIKDLIAPVSKGTSVPSGSQVVGIYSQTGVNLASFTFGTETLNTSEIGGDLHLTGGFLWMYDGYLPVEDSFFLYPDIGPTTPPSAINASVAAWSATGGSMAAQPNGSTNANVYFYQITYEWTDNQGNAFKSAPSIPISVTTTGALSTGSVVLSIPTLRLTAKTANPVKIVVYRWSIAQQAYYQCTSITSPLLNDTTVDLVTFTDTSSDATILGNSILYTTGGVIENINAPASDANTLFDSRFWLINAENPNELWFSKTVVPGTPAEMSDLLTIPVPATTGTQGSTGPMKTVAPMDDKLIIGKRNAFLYINGTGPDNTGANNQYSEPIFITSTVGCENQRSIVLMPDGLMFQSDKGIWLLARNLSTSYIGAPVEDFTQGATVLSAVNVPETNQVRFTLDSGITLMYDYFYGQWGVFKGVPCLSSCIFEEKHTFINSYGKVYQESSGSYLDGSNPVLLAFETGPLRVGDLQNYQRGYFFYLLGEFKSPHKLRVSIKYDYEASPSQSVIITPQNYSTPYGSGLSQSPYGQQDTYGGPSSLEHWRVFLERQRCMAFSVIVEEIFDPSYGTTADEGLTISGINLVAAFKKGYVPQPNATTVG